MDRIKIRPSSLTARFTLGDGPDTVVEVWSHFDGSLVRDNAGWTYHDADYMRVCDAIVGEIDQEWSSGSVSVDESSIPVRRI